MPVVQSQINEDLDSKDQSGSEFQAKLLQQYHGFMLASCARMSDYWQSWDRHDQIYRGYRIFDRDDKSAVKRKEPAKMIVPVSFVCDHIETLYELDQVYKNLAKDSGIQQFVRSRTFNDDAQFPKVLKSVLEHSGFLP